MKKLLALTCCLALFAVNSMAQPKGYDIKVVKSLKTTPVKDQASSGTCWCFATTSFMETELLRKGKPEFDLSEMFIVRQKYLNQFNDNYLKQGKGSLSQGSLAHTFINAYNEVGIVPEEVYDGINYDSKEHNHRELNAYVKAIGEAAIKLKQRSPEYYELVNNLLDTYLGEVPEKFEYEGKTYTPKSFAEMLELDMDDYVEITSFNHKPFYSEFALEIPDNWESEKMYNVPIDELIEIMNHAIDNGYSVCWDGDVSERGFLYRKGIAINPQVESVKDYSTTDRANFEKLKPKDRYKEIMKLEKPFPEINVTQEVRQKGYENFTTEDDHLMHITGIAKDCNGTTYYITKNSWAEDGNDFGGYLDMSESYVRAKTIFIMVHKDAIPKAIRKKLGL